MVGDEGAMSDGIEHRVEELENKVRALQQLLLSHILAFDQVDLLATDATFDIALSQLDAALDDGRDPIAVRLAGLIESVQKARE
jgi:hypothetical protein